MLNASESNWHSPKVISLYHPKTVSAGSATPWARGVGAHVSVPGGDGETPQDHEGYPPEGRETSLCGRCCQFTTPPSPEEHKSL